MTGGSADSLDIRVDLRKSWGEVREQGQRMSCLACAASDAHGHSHKRDRPLSAEFLFFQAAERMPRKDVSAGVTFSAIDHALQAEGQPDESEWPYTKTQPNPWTPPSVSQRWYGSLTSTTSDVMSIFKLLEAQQPVVLGLRVTQAFIDLKATPFVVPAGGRGYGGHAVLAVGIANSATYGSLILIRNSWGTKWGDTGHGWLSKDYLNDNLIGYRIVNPMP